MHNNNTEGVASWAGSFEKLLDDPIALQTFAVSITPERARKILTLSFLAGISKKGVFRREHLFLDGLRAVS